jgi:hypothetical protein
VSRGRSNACNPLSPRIDKNLGNPVVKRYRTVRLRIVGGYVFYPSTMAPPVPHTPSTMVSCAPSDKVSCTFFRSGAALPLWGVARSTIRNPAYVTEAKRNRAHRGTGSRRAADRNKPSTREPAEPMNQRTSPAERGMSAGRGLLATHARPRGGAHLVPGAHGTHQINFLSHHRPGCQSSLTDGSDLPDDPPTCMWALKTLSVARR